MGLLRHIASCPPRSHTAASNCATEAPRVAQRPWRLAAKQDRSVSPEELQRVNTNIFIYPHNNRGKTEPLISALSFETRKSLFIYFPFGPFCFFLSLPARRPRCSSFRSFITLSDFLSQSRFSVDSGSVVFNLRWLNLFGSRCSATVALIILLCEWHERFRSRFRMCSYSKQRSLQFFVFVLFFSSYCAQMQFHSQKVIENQSVIAFFFLVVVSF